MHVDPVHIFDHLQLGVEHREGTAKRRGSGAAALGPLAGPGRGVYWTPQGGYWLLKFRTNRGASRPHFRTRKLRPSTSDPVAPGPDPWRTAEGRRRVRPSASGPAAPGPDPCSSSPGPTSTYFSATKQQKMEACVRHKFVFPPTPHRPSLGPPSPSHTPPPLLGSQLDPTEPVVVAIVREAFFAVSATGAASSASSATRPATEDEGIAERDGRPLR